MVADVTLSGIQKFEQVAKDVKAAGKDIQKKLYRGLEVAAKPAKEAVPKSAKAVLPNRGGLADYVAGMKIRTRRKSVGKGAGIRLEGSVAGIQSTLRKVAKRKHVAKKRAKQRSADRAYERAVKAEEG